MEFTRSLVEELIDKISQIEESVDIIKERVKNYAGLNEILSAPIGVMVLDACIMRLQVIGEAVKTIDNKTSGEFLSQFPAIPWRSIIGLRNIISHDYANVDYDMVWHIISTDLLPLRREVGLVKAALLSADATKS